MLEANDIDEEMAKLLASGVIEMTVVLKGLRHLFPDSLE